MRRITCLIFIGLFLLTLPGLALAAPSFTLNIGSDSWTRELSEIKPGIYSYTGSSEFKTSSGSVANFFLTIDSDPFIAYGFTATNTTAAAVKFSFSVPALTIGPYNPGKVRASIAGGLTDATGNGVTITPFLDWVTFNFTESATWLVGDFFTVGPSEAGSFTYPADYFTGTFPGPHTRFGLIVDFTLSGDNDVVSLTGYSSVDAAPLPASLLLLGSGILGLLGIGACRKFP